jgi:hypothetical protein
MTQLQSFALYNFSPRNGRLEGETDTRLNNAIKIVALFFKDNVCGQ